ncbi:MAG: FecR family protein [Parabacteroides sp.]|nr:FecR family protein [Parabacteroides sp.]
MSWERLVRKRESSGSYAHRIWRSWGKYVAVAVITVILTSSLFPVLGNRSESLPIRYVGGNGLEADVAILPDGSRVSLGSKTNFYCDAHYGDKDRVVYLEGEAYFEVAKEKDKPFIVKVKGQDIEALGTKFNVMAYPKDSLFITTLQEGCVKLTTLDLSKPMFLKPDHQFVYNRCTHAASITRVDANQFISWTSGYYYFPEQTLEAILYRLGHVYGIDFSVKSERLNKQIFTGTFYRGQSPKNIMEIINLSIPIKYEIDEHKVTLWE